MSDNTDTTTVKKENVNFDDILGASTDSVMVPGEEGEKKNKGIFAPVKTDLSFLDNPGDPGAGEPDQEDPPANSPVAGEDDPAPADPPADPPANFSTNTDEVLGQPGDNIASIENDDKNKGGRPKGFVTAFNKLFEEKILVPFQDDKKLDDYTAEDIQELLKANIEHTKEQLQEQLPQQFFGSMPPEMQQAYHYLASGGTDMKGMFQALASSQEMKDIDVTEESGQIYAVRSYLQATGYGNSQEIEEEIQSLRDRGDLEKKANQFKPKLDAMSQDMVNQRIAAQQQEAARREAQSKAYTDNVYNVLATGKLNDIALNSDTQNRLFAGLVQPNYQSAVSGKPTNQLGHLLEKYQWIEPRHDLIAEALWLLSDPDGYRAEIKSQGATAAAGDTVRKLKTAEANKTGSTSVPDNDGGAQRPAARPGLQRKESKNFFKR